MKILLLCNYDPTNAAMVTEHINAIKDLSRGEVFVYNQLVQNRGNLDLSVDIGSFDAVIVHYSIFVAVEQYCSAKTRQLLSRFGGVKVVFIQDEYRFVDRTLAALKEIGADILFTCVPEPSIEAVYPRAAMGRMRIVNTLTGYPSDFLSVLQPVQLGKRKYDVSYRGRRYPDWHGSLGREKFEIAEKFLQHSGRHGLRTNISCKERDRVYGAAWVALIQNSRAVLGVESGASVFDFRGEISLKTETQRALHGKTGISYEALRERYFASVENSIDLTQISPRIFEAICLRTLCILYEGNYSGILVPNVHYLPLKKDFSNIDDVCRKLKDDGYVSDIITNAYNDVAFGQKHTYRAMVQKLDSEIEAVRTEKKHAPAEISDVGNFRKRFGEKHPFYMVPYPHSFVTGRKRSFINWLKQMLPDSLKFRLKSLLR